MSFDVNWDIDKYKDDHENEEHWQLRYEFMKKWKNDYPEERLVCLARVFANMEFLGCRYPTEVMQEVARLSHEIVKSYRLSRKTKLQRTFVSASDAAIERAKGIKRHGGKIITDTPAKHERIAFVKPQNKGEIAVSDSDNEITNTETPTEDTRLKPDATCYEEKLAQSKQNLDEYVEEMLKVKCVDIGQFNKNMFNTPFGRLVLLVRPWATKMWNIQASCKACQLQIESTYENGCFSLNLSGRLLARATGPTKPEAKALVEIMAWNRLKQETVSVVVKEVWIAQNDARIGVHDVAGVPREDQFGTPVENNVALKMMKMMGWKGGGLGADAQGIEEPIKPNLQMVNRAGLGSSSSDIYQLKRAASSLMQRYLRSDSLDLDLVFSAEFCKDERAALHHVAQRMGLASRSYGDKDDRFLVVKKKLDPFSLVHAVIEKGGNTPKYQVFIPAALCRKNRN